MATAKTAPITVEFQYEKDTANTVRYTEVVDDGADKLVGVLYIQKNTAARLGKPEKLTVTLAVG